MISLVRSSGVLWKFKSRLRRRSFLADREPFGSGGHAMLPSLLHAQSWVDAGVEAAVEADSS